MLLFMVVNSSSNPIKKEPIVIKNIFEQKSSSKAYLNREKPTTSNLAELENTIEKKKFFFLLLL